MLVQFPVSSLLIQGHPVDVYFFFLVFPPLLPIPLSFLKNIFRRQFLRKM
jgi:hypothetical protein